MVNYSRSFITGKQKVLLSLLVIAIGVVLVTSPATAEPILAFLLGGVVPGTDVILSPEVMMWSVGGIMLALGFFIATRIMVSRRRRWQRAARPEAVVSKHIPIIDISESDVPVDSTDPQRTKSRNHYAFITSFWRALGDVITSSGAAIKVVTLFVARILVISVVTIGSGLVQGSRLIGSTTVRSAKGLYHALLSLRRKIQPRLQRFDAKLEILVRKVEKAISTRLNRHDALRAFKAASKEYKKSLKDWHPPTLSPSIRQKVGRIKGRPTSEVSKP